MQIKINKNIDKIEANFFLGFSLIQCIYGVVGFLLSVVVYLGASKILGGFLATYVAIFASCPIILCGFMKIDDMSFLEYVKKYFVFIKERNLVYNTEILLEEKQEEKEEKKKWEFLRLMDLKIIKKQTKLK